MSPGAPVGRSRASGSNGPPSTLDRYITAPNAQGTNSFCPYPCTSLFVFSPDAVRSINRKMRSPIASMLALPSITSPQLMSMSSSCLPHSAVLVESFYDGDGAHS